MHKRPAMLAAMLAIISLLAQPLLAGQSGAAAAGDLSRDRDKIVSQLVELGYASHEANEMAGQLTTADLEVLLGNPGMMQRAGIGDPMVWAFVVGIAVVAGLVVLASNGSGSVLIN